MTVLNPDAETRFEKLLEDLPEETVQLARQFKAFTRARKIKTPAQLMRVVLLYCGLDQSLREVAATMTLLEERITDQAVLERLAVCGPWLKAVLEQMLPAVPTLPRRFRVLLIDGSTVEGPGAKGTNYRLHLCFDLVEMTFTEILITDKHTGESLKHFTLQAGDLAIADRGFCHPRPMLEAAKNGADLLVRLSGHSVPLFDRQGRVLDLVKTLKAQPLAPFRTIEVLIGPSRSSERLAGWVHAYRLPEAAAAAARRRARKNAKSGHEPTEKTLYLAGWVIVFTTVAPSLLSAETILTLYRCRWQIELAIKRWKSLLDVARLRSREGGTLAEVWLHGKLVYAVLLEQRTRHRVGAGWGNFDTVRTGTFWRLWKLLSQAMVPLIVGVASWQEQQWADALEVLMERRRRRQLQSLPEQARALVETEEQTKLAGRLLRMAA